MIDGPTVLDKKVYQSTVQRSLANALPNFFDPNRVGGYNIFPGEPVAELKQDLVRVPVMLGHSSDSYLGGTLNKLKGQLGDERLTSGQRESTTRAIEQLERKEEKSKCLGEVSLGCDYLLNKGGEIIYKPQPEDLEGRIAVVARARYHL